MKAHSIPGLAIFLLLVTAASYGFVSGPQTDSDPKLFLTGVDFTSSHVIIRYDITFPGFTELHLFESSTSKKVWIHGVADKEIGSQEMRVPTRNMKPGETYKYILKYKGKDYEGTFATP